AFTGDHARNNELIRDSLVVRILDRCDWIASPAAFAVDHGVVRFLDPVPAIVPVHGVIPAHHGGDLSVGSAASLAAAAIFPHLLLKRGNVFHAVCGWRVASVEKDVYEKVLHTLL